MNYFLNNYLINIINNIAYLCLKNMINKLSMTDHDSYIYRIDTRVKNSNIGTKSRSKEKKNRCTSFLCCLDFPSFQTKKKKSLLVRQMVLTEQTR